MPPARELTYGPPPTASEHAIQHAQTLYTKLAASYPILVDRFETAFTAWKNACEAPHIMLRSTLGPRCSIPEYEALVDMGTSILPLVAYKLARNDILCYPLYNDIETNPKWKANRSMIYSAQGYAAHNVELSYDLSLEFENNAKKWEEHQLQNRWSSISSDYLGGEGYEALVGMGSSVVGLVMVRYAEDRSSWTWGALMQEIVHPGERKNRDGNFCSERLFEFWKALFEGAKKDDGRGPGSEEDGFWTGEDVVDSNDFHTRCHL